MRPDRVAQRLRRLCLSLPEASEVADVDLLLHRKQFFPTPYGRGQWVSLWADTAVDWYLVQKLVHRSYRLVALKRMLLALDGTKRIAE